MNQMLLSDDSLADWGNFSINHVSQSIKEESKSLVEDKADKQVSFAQTESEPPAPDYMPAPTPTGHYQTEKKAIEKKTKKSRGRAPIISIKAPSGVIGEDF